MRMLGTDPEIFAKRPEDLHVTPAFDVLRGDIDVPLPYGIAYPDGLAVEFNVRPDESPTVVVERMFKNYETISEFMGERGFVPCLGSNEYVSIETINRFPESFGKRASLQILGCDVDRNVHMEDEGIRRPDPKTYTYRTLGGHIHIGIPESVANNLLQMQCIVLGLDATVGLLTTMRNYDISERTRRKLYGRRGTYRVPEYSPGIFGVEYRVPSAKAILGHKDQSIETFTIAKAAVEVMLQRIENAGDDEDRLIDNIADLLDIDGGITYAINNCDMMYCSDLYRGRFSTEVQAYAKRI